jgi:hypothetical protein
MNDEEFFEFIQKSIMKLYHDAAPVKGHWVVIKCDSSLGRLNPTLLAYLRYHGFILYPGIPNTTAVSQETDQSYGPFQDAVCSRTFKVGRTHRICCEDPETGLIVESAFQRGFSHVHNINVWAKVGAVPLSRSCLQNPKVRRAIGDGNNEQQVLVQLIVEHNTIACNALSLEGSMAT